MKRIAFVLVVAACEPAELDHPIEPGGTGTFVSGWTQGDSEPSPDAGTPGGGGDGGGGGIDGGPLSDAGGLGPDAATQLDAGIIDFFDAGTTPAP